MIAKKGEEKSHNNGRSPTCYSQTIKKKADMKMAEIAKQGTVLHATEKKFFLRKV